MDNGYVLLVEKEEMWAKMLMQTLESNNIPCAARPVYGAGFTIKTGNQERLEVYVPSENLTKAAELVQVLFSGEAGQEE